MVSGGCFINWLLQRHLFLLFPKVMASLLFLNQQLPPELEGDTLPRGGRRGPRGVQPWVTVLIPRQAELCLGPR